MKMPMMAVYDRSAASFGRLFTAPSIEAGTRDFTDEANRQADANMIYKHPDDFDLYLVGFWNPENADITDEGETELPRIVVRAKDVKKPTVEMLDYVAAYEQLQVAIDEIKIAHQQELTALTDHYENNLRGTQALQRAKDAWYLRIWNAL